MKKFLLSSIIMLGVCGAANAQTGAKTKKNDLSAAGTSTSAAAPTPQKAAVIPQSDAVAPAATTRTAADKEAASVAPVTRIKTKPAQVQAPATVNAAGVVVSDEEKVKAEKAAAAKATGENDKRNN